MFTVLFTLAACPVGSPTGARCTTTRLTKIGQPRQLYTGYTERDYVAMGRPVDMANLEKPEVEFPDGPAPAELVISDIVVGDGAEALPGATSTCTTWALSTTAVRSSTPRGAAAGRSRVPAEPAHPGWQEGHSGMKVGGRRRLTVPLPWPTVPQVPGTGCPGKTLVFVIDLLGVS